MHVNNNYETDIHRSFVRSFSVIPLNALNTAMLFLEQ